MQQEKTTSWGGVADWYDEHLEKQVGTYQKELILPNLLRLMDIRPGEIVLDIGCGQGFFSRVFQAEGARVIASDISQELIKIAKERSPKEIQYYVAPGDKLNFAKDKSADKATIVLAIQNIENMGGVFHEAARVLKPHGRLYVVLNHPAFRIPKASSWGYDKETNIQYRRIDNYLSESKVKIQMHPGDKPSAYTVSFHRPLQSYVKALGKAGFMVRRLEEWNSHKRSEPGPRAVSENRARKEIPLFLVLEGEVG